MVDDPEVRISVVERGEASPVSPVDEVFDLRRRRSSAEHFPDAVIAPYVQTGATDSRHFTRICEHVYRFAPFRMTAAQRRASTPTTSTSASTRSWPASTGTSR